MCEHSNGNHRSRSSAGDSGEFVTEADVENLRI